MHKMPGANVINYMGKSPKLADSVFLASGAQLIGDLEIGEQSSVWFNTVIRADCCYIRIGQRSNIQDQTVIHVTKNKHPTIIGDDVTIGHGVILHGCKIGNRCLIGMGATIMDGVEIPDDSFIAAGALVTPFKSFESGKLIKGVPANAVRDLKEEEKKAIMYNRDNYLEYTANYLKGMEN